MVGVAARAVVAVVVVMVALGGHNVAAGRAAGAA
jgi:hypothetical protein